MPHSSSPRERTLRVVSLGGGVQSTAMLLMGLAGEFGPPPEVALFADTGWEPPEVYAHLAWLEQTVAPFPILRLTTGNLRQDLLDAAAGRTRRVANPPFFTRSGHGSDACCAGTARATTKYGRSTAPRASSSRPPDAPLRRSGSVSQWMKRTG